MPPQSLTGGKEVSTHASVRRRRAWWRRWRGGSGFNSRLREEATLRPSAVLYRCKRFNSRLREEATNGGEVSPELALSFNSRLREEATATACFFW